MDLALNNLQRLICHKTQQTKPNLLSFLLFLTNFSFFYSSLFLSFFIFPIHLFYLVLSLKLLSSGIHLFLLFFQLFSFFISTIILLLFFFFLSLFPLLSFSLVISESSFRAVIHSFHLFFSLIFFHFTSFISLLHSNLLRLLQLTSFVFFSWLPSHLACTRRHQLKESVAKYSNWANFSKHNGSDRKQAMHNLVTDLNQISRTKKCTQFINKNN